MCVKNKIKCGDELRVTSALDAVAELWLTLAVCADIENIPFFKKNLVSVEQCLKLTKGGKQIVATRCVVFGMKTQLNSTCVYLI